MYIVTLIKTDANGDTLWTKRFEGANIDDAFSVLQTSDGGYIIAGERVSSGSNEDVYLVKTDANGNVLWSKSYGGTTNDEVGNSVKQTTDGGFIIAGRTLSFGAGMTDFYLVKTDANGSLLWSKTYGGTNTDEAYSVQPTIDGGFIIGGFTESFGAGNGDAYFIKTDSIGNLLWSRTFGTTINDQVLAIRQTTDGGYIAVGQNAVSDSITTGYTDVFLVKTDVNGDLLWAKSYGESNNEYGKAIEQTTDGGYIIAGTKYVPTIPYFDFYLIKTDVQGNSRCNERVSSIVQTNPTTVQGNPATVVSTAGYNISSPPTIVKIPLTTETIFCSTAGVNEIAEKCFINIFPNPFSIQTTLQTDKPFTNAILKVYNCFGQEVKEIKNINGDAITLQRGNLPSGLYFIRLSQDSKIVTTEKLVIEDN